MLVQIEYVKVGQYLQQGEICMIEDHPSRSKFLVRYWNWSTVDSDEWKNEYGDDGVWVEYGSKICVWNDREDVPKPFFITTAQAGEAFQTLTADGNRMFGTGAVHPDYWER